MYNRFVTPTPLMDVHQGMGNNPQRKAFSYTGFPKSDANSSITLSVCTSTPNLEGS